MLFVWIGMAFGQERNITGHNYVVKVDVPVKEFDMENEQSSDFFIAKSNTKFTTIEVISDEVLIKFWDYEGEQQLSPRKLNDSLSRTYSFINAATSKNKYFVMQLKDFDTKIEPINGRSSSFTWGVTIIPIKLRFGNGEKRLFQYSESFSLGINAGYEYAFTSRRKESVSFLLGVAVSSVPVDPKDNIILEKSTTVGAFTPSIGIVYSYEQFQVGIFSGIDYLSGELGKNWMYRNKPWLGLGLGFSIFQKNKKESDLMQTQKEK